MLKFSSDAVNFIVGCGLGQQKVCSCTRPTMYLVKASQEQVQRDPALRSELMKLKITPFGYYATLAQQELSSESASSLFSEGGDSDVSAGQVYNGDHEDDFAYSTL